MKKFILSAVLLMVAAAVNASELPKLTPRIMHGPLIGVTMVTRDDLGQYHAQLFNGAGYEIGISFVDAETFSWFAIGLPQVMSADSATDSFRYSLGLSMKLMGNFGVGAIYDLIKTGEGTDSGLFTGYSDKENLSFLFTFTLPLGGGGIVNAYR